MIKYPTMKTDATAQDQIVNVVPHSQRALGTPYTTAKIVYSSNPYGLEETNQGCINRTKQFKNGQSFISIENGFVRATEKIWYDIAFIYIRINNTIYSGWSSKREFPSNLFDNTRELVKHFEKNSITRHKQLSDCLNKIISKME
jgi:non-canonical (house-cleaning) NTP pyrophosphatase